MGLYFHCIDVDCPLTTSATRQWIKTIIKKHQYTLKTVNIIFCNDNYLLQINKQYLGHDYYTDVITFNNRELGGEVEGDIFISTERVKEHAAVYNTSFFGELHRVIIHGILHLLGYRDHTPFLQSTMRQKEDHCLQQLTQQRKRNNR